MTDEQVKYLQLIRKGSEELHDVAETLLTVSSVQLGHSQPHIESTDLQLLLKEVAEQFQTDAQAQDVELTVDATTPDLTIQSDHQLLRVALRCLVRNAVFFTQHGSVLLSARQTGDGFEISVKDTGAGIPAEDVPEIFTKFFQAANGKKMYPTGKGLGLYLARICVETLGGHAAVSSELGKGSTFRLLLPHA